MSAGDLGKAFLWEDYFASDPLEWLAVKYKAGLTTLEGYVLSGLGTHKWTIETPDGQRIIGGMDQAILAERIGKKPRAIHDAVNRLVDKGLIKRYKKGKPGSYALYILFPNEPLPPIKEPNRNSGQTSKRPAQQCEGSTLNPPPRKRMPQVERKNTTTPRVVPMP